MLGVEIADEMAAELLLLTSIAGWNPSPPSSKGVNVIGTTAISFGRGSLPRCAGSSVLKRQVMVESVVADTREEKDMSWATPLMM